MRMEMGTVDPNWIIVMEITSISDILQMNMLIRFLLFYFRDRVSQFM